MPLTSPSISLLARPRIRHYQRGIAAIRDCDLLWPWLGRKLVLMKAIQMTRFGGPDVLVLADVATPKPGAGQVLIRIATAGVNFAETLMRVDQYVASYTLPATPGSEVTGTIEAIGDGVDGLAIGQRVGAVLAAAKMLTGGYAEYCIADAAVTVPLPDELDFDEACALLVQGLTALYLTREVGPAGRDVLITAGGGGVGSLLIQLARYAGAKSVTAAASSPAKCELAVSVGADRAIKYDELGSIAPTLIYDSVGGDVFTQCFDILAAKGVLVAYGALNLQSFALGVPELRRMVFGNQTFRGFAFGPLIQHDLMREDLQHLFAMVRQGVLKPIIGERYRLADAAEAHRALGQRSTSGKLVLHP
jgi:NADPH2:quinone reductase